jgi:hypothetical protein
LLITTSCTVAGNVDIVLNGVTFTVAIGTGDVNNTAATIRNASYTGYNTAQGATSADVIFTSIYGRTETSPSYTLVTATGGAGTITIVTAGTNANDSVVSLTTLPTVIGNGLRLLYKENPLFPDLTNRIVYLNISSTASIKTQIVLQKIF